MYCDFWHIWKETWQYLLYTRKINSMPTLIQTNDESKWDMSEVITPLFITPSFWQALNQVLHESHVLSLYSATQMGIFHMEFACFLNPCMILSSTFQLHAEWRSTSFIFTLLSDVPFFSYLKKQSVIILSSGYCLAAMFFLCHLLGKNLVLLVALCRKTSWTLVTPLILNIQCIFLMLSTASETLKCDSFTRQMSREVIYSHVCTHYLLC